MSTRFETRIAFRTATALALALVANSGCSSEDEGATGGDESSTGEGTGTESPTAGPTTADRPTSTTGEPDPSASTDTTDGTPETTDGPEPSTSSGGSEFDVELEETDLGTILVDRSGRTLYLFTRDLPGPDDTSTSNCVDDCVGVWPLFQAEVANVGPGLDVDDFGTITREADGETQATYKGWPLYYFAQDQAAGDALGEDVNNVWYVVPEPFYTVAARNGGMDIGNYFADPAGGSLYILTSDTPGTDENDPVSNCNGPCVGNWPLFAPSEFNTLSVLDSGDFTTFERADGEPQAAYQGRPLYYFAGDAQPGDTAGHQLPGPMDDGEWLLLDPFGR